MNPIVYITKDSDFYVVFVNNAEISRQKSLVKATKKLADYIKSQPQIKG